MNGNIEIPQVVLVRHSIDAGNPGETNDAQL
jgi:hypothetical protein